MHKGEMFSGGTTGPALLLFGVALFLRLFLAPYPGFPGDMAVNLAYVNQANAHGVTSVPDLFAGTDSEMLPPLFVYQAAAVGRFATGRLAALRQQYPSVADVWERVRFKLLPIAYDMVTGLVILLVLGNLAPAPWPLVGAAGYLLNPGVVINSAYWGQFDSIHSFFLLLVVLCLCRGWRTTHDGWLIGAWLVFALAVCAKLQSIVLLPVLFAVTIVHRKPAKALIAMAGCGLAVTALYSPFLLVHRWDYLERVFVRSFTRYGNTCVNGFNLWGLWVVRPSAERVLGLSYAHLGQLLYLGCVGWYCVWLARAVSARIGQETSRQLLLVAAYACVAPFMVLTGMHERYIAPAIVFLVMAACLDRRLWWLAVGFSVTYALNLLYVLWKSGPAPPEEWAIRDASKFALRVFSSLLNIALFGWLTVKLSALLVPGSSEQVGSSSVPSA